MLLEKSLRCCSSKFPQKYSLAELWEPRRLCIVGLQHPVLLIFSPTTSQLIMSLLPKIKWLSCTVFGKIYTRMSPGPSANTEAAAGTH